MKQTLSKLELSYTDENDKEHSYVFQYNPNSIKIEKSIEWAAADGNQKDVPEKQFVNGKAKTISIDGIFFDTTTIGNMSVYTNFIKPIESMAIVRSFKVTSDKTIKRPPHITLSWGKSSYFFECVLTKIDYSFKMFTREGIPTRAEVGLSFEEIVTDSTKKQEVKNQTAAKTYVTKKGETLYEIAEKEYKDSNKWKIIATANEIDNPFKVPTGITLSLPVLS